MSGRVVQGRVRTGDKVLMMPLEDPASVVRLERNGAFARTACAGDNAEMTLSGVDVARVVVGNVVCKAGGALPAVKRFSAQIIALPELEVGWGVRRAITSLDPLHLYGCPFFVGGNSEKGFWEGRYDGPHLFPFGLLINPHPDIQKKK